MINRVAVSGKMTSGKTHVSDFLIQKYGFRRISLAGPVKEIEAAVAELGVMHTDLSKRIWTSLGEGHVITNEQYWKFYKILEEELIKIPRDDLKARKRLQWIGTELGRKQIDPDLWVKLALHQITSASSEIKWVCDDIRFPNEYEAFTSIEFTGLKLVVSPEVQRERLQVLYNLTDEEIKERMAHDSEALVDTIPIPETNWIDADQPLMKMYQAIEKRLGFK